jgi:hypothetical protein
MLCSHISPMCNVHYTRYNIRPTQIIIQITVVDHALTDNQPHLKPNDEKQKICSADPSRYRSISTPKT